MQRSQRNAEETPNFCFSLRTSASFATLRCSLYLKLRHYLIIGMLDKNESPRLGCFGLFVLSQGSAALRASFYSECEHLVGIHSPLGQFPHIADLCTLDELEILDTP